MNYRSKGYTQYGAFMGRSSDLSNATPGELSVKRVTLDSGGYDPGGAYWGHPQDLFCVSDADDRVRYVRAASFDAARALFPTATWGSRTIDSGDIDDMLAAYITAALWTSNDDDGDPLDTNYSERDLDPVTLETMRSDCRRFVDSNALTFAAIPDLDWTQVGHDFWLSRNIRGAGFADRDCYAGREDDLSAACGRRSPFREVDLYLGDDGKIHA